ncbi:MAG: DUF6134 family protein [Alphaproteobacteria bacterium]|jgi:hypothetical protein
MQTIAIPRRALLAAAPAALAFPRSARALPTDTPILFTVLRGGAPIGRHRVAFAQSGATLAVEIEIDLEVRFATIPVYRYVHRSREEWDGRRFIGLDARTDDNGTRTEVRVRPAAGGLAVSGSGGDFLAPPETKPTSYWHEDMTRRTRLLDTQAGTLIDVRARQSGTERASIAGREVEMRVYEVTGDLTSRLGYTQSGEWVDLEFKARGSTIRYRRDTPPAAA